MRTWFRPTLRRFALSCSFKEHPSCQGTPSCLPLIRLPNKGLQTTSETLLTCCTSDPTTAEEPLSRLRFQSSYYSRAFTSVKALHPVLPSFITGIQTPNYLQNIADDAHLVPTNAEEPLVTCTSDFLPSLEHPLPCQGHHAVIGKHDFELPPNHN